ncbi:hypothetical protein SGLAM104S_06281 [Streptomyces glaucescens]
MIESGAQSTAKVWKASAKAWPFGRVYPAPMPPEPEYPGPWSVPCTVEGSKPTFSMTSISPELGQPTWPRSVPSIQNAGHMPCPRGIFIRASTCPYWALNFPAVFSRAEVYWQLPYQHW